MPDIKIKKEDLIKQLGVELTDEQLAKVNDITIEIDETKPKELSWEDAKKKFKKELGEEKTAAIKARFKNKTGDDDNNGVVDVEKIKAEIAKDTRRELTINNAIKDFNDKKLAKLFIDDALKGDKTLDEVLDEATDKFAPKKTVRKLNDFGTEVDKKDDGTIIDPLADALDEEIKRLG